MKTYNVLWIDDEIDKLSSFIIDAEYHDIYITAYDTAKEGMKAYKENLMKWDGVILDAKCLRDSKDEVANIGGLYFSLANITELKYKRNIPVFIYTGQPDLYGDDQF